MDPRRKSQILLTVWLSIPVLLIAALMYAVAYAIDHGPVGGYHEPIGAGGGDTGGANAIGEAFRHRDTDRDTTPDPGAAGEEPSEPDR